MLVRIVKMTFQPEQTDAFLELFEQKKEHIRNFEGCSFLELYQDKNNTNIFFTYSYWNDENALENYRHSDLFKEVWKETKAKFSGRAEAWSVNKIVSLT